MIAPIIHSNGIPYVDSTRIIGKRVSERPRSGQTRTGYGNALPTEHEVQLDDQRWRRVYVVCFSNSGTAYIRVNGKKQYFASNFDFEV